ncbi:aspartate carbamoyltransferase regulatory subunit [Anaerococcus hydrogenalis]|uniref:Aspartate carbamoyltransferase regulatory chain, allosteric domain protein n=2 Tax=Anaerococcus hydrogenalis TaxID=33029 RepID=F0GZM2_9FIRM|nr:aspartate carbamoyltransferase regulatory subunit [Anaerococcus hydrogenalis]EGC84296.1 aspartate carbamoyltransferase regulatory chain, allosteric domain protein [Anaerococcus hydrogenalis ACS-025-V-Sch4]MBS5988344.1 aspartate carbamoyltransferase regulatory subunit [Anaerococcus hydrogenalis]MDK7694597.1 aspartate carbamoyltransferase regulatory subunit [Anaerococcus hydrogenalis]MDK7696375.1 aspartate carbamoyltransferase regulatory subunit [Anaerococcus hydrogenalis]MDK7707624.1 asparta
MLEITSLKKGIVIDHIKTGLGIKIFNLLHLDEIEDEVALILNANSTSNGKKDIVKIANNLDINLDAVAIIDPSATVNFIEDEKVVIKKNIELPEKIEGILKCQNPSCITANERNVESKFILIDRKEKMYKCNYCDHIYDVEE